MTKYEYKTIRINMKGWGVKSRKIPDLESTLNREGKEGWRLREIVQPSGIQGSATAVVVILERELVEKTID